jgi:gliding motility-associated-like protein
MKLFNSYTFLRIFAFLLVLLISLQMNGQISFKGVQYKSFQTNYPVTQQYDSIFILNNLSGDRDFTQDSLVAYSTGRSNLTFSWFKIDMSTGKLAEKAFFVEKGDVSKIGNLTYNGYYVQISDGVVSVDSFRVWVFAASKFKLKVEKTDDGKVKEFNCSSLLLKATLDVDTFYYVDPTKGTQVKFEPTKLLSSYGWNEAQKKLSARIYDPPYVNTTYSFSATHIFGATVSDKVLYESVVPHAEFSIQVKNHKGEFEDYSEDEGASATVIAQFTNKSENADRYTWFLTDSTFGYKDKPSVVDTAEKSFQPEYYYRIPYTYKVRLVAINDKYGCTDTTEYQNIEVVESKVDSSYIPNVFTPGCTSGVNDFYRPYFKSVREIKMYIFNPYGRTVYEYEKKDNQDNRLQDWEGWDGTKNGKDVPQGVYYYVIETKGWDGVKKKYAGPLYLFRNAK